MSNQEIPKEILDAINRDTQIKSKNASHIQRIGVWNIYLNFINSLFPSLAKYSGLGVSLYAAIKAVKSDTIKTLIEFATKQDNWIMFLILCLTFVLSLFINKKYK